MVGLQEIAKILQIPFSNKFDKLNEGYTPGALPGNQNNELSCGYTAGALPGNQNNNNTGNCSGKGPIAYYTDANKWDDCKNNNNNTNNNINDASCAKILTYLHHFPCIHESLKECLIARIGYNLYYDIVSNENKINCDRDYTLESKISQGIARYNKEYNSKCTKFRMHVADIKIYEDIYLRPRLYIKDPMEGIVRHIRACDKLGYKKLQSCTQFQINNLAWNCCLKGNISKRFENCKKYGRQICKEFYEYGLVMFQPHFIPSSAKITFMNSCNSRKSNRVTYYFLIDCGNNPQCINDTINGLYWFNNCLKLDKISCQWRFAPVGLIENCDTEELQEYTNRFTRERKYYNKCKPIHSLYCR